MKRFLFPLFLFIYTSSFSQKESFEGIMHFDIKYVLHNPNSNPKNYPTKMKVYIKDGYYLQYYSGNGQYTKLLYRPDMNKCFTSYKKPKETYVEDFSEPEDTLLSITESDSIIQLLDRNCKKISFQYPEQRVTFYYAPDLYMNPENFTQHKHFHYDKYSKKSESIYLKMVIQTAEYDYIATATKVKPKALKMSLFDL